MKTVDYNHTLAKENEELKGLCKKHVETIRMIKRELIKLNSTISKKDKKIIKLESDSLNIKAQKELDEVKQKFNKLKAEYDTLQHKYNSVVSENEGLKKIFDEIESLCDSD